MLFPINAIQLLLIVGILLLFVYSYTRLRSSYFDAFLIILFAAIEIFFVFFPDYTTVIAHYLGVGRGVDMIFYLAILFFAFICMKLYHKVRKLEQTITNIIREKGIKNAAFLGGKEKSAGDRSF
ncbi:MAG: DUF2304 domain-containing protein [Chitinophagaceae bacterium]